MNARPGLSYCADQVRRHDPDRYLAALFAPPEAREALFALYAFDDEIERVRHVVREPMAGLVRLQWWREALAGLEAGAATGQPVIAAMRAQRASFASLRPRLDAAIDARDLELSAEPPADLAELERRLEAGCGSISMAAVELLGACDEAVRVAARHLGVARGLTRLVQALPRAMERERMRLPALLLERHEIDRERLPRTRDGRALAPVVAELATQARAHLRDARRQRRRIPRRALAALLHASLLDRYLKRLARAGYDPSAPVLARPSATAPLALLARHLAGRY